MRTKGLSSDIPAKTTSKRLGSAKTSATTSGERPMERRSPPSSFCKRACTSGAPGTGLGEGLPNDRFELVRNRLGRVVEVDFVMLAEGTPALLGDEPMDHFDGRPLF